MCIYLPYTSYIMADAFTRMITAMKEGNRAVFVAARYELAGEGEALSVRNQDLKRVHLDNLPLHFLVFIDCDMGGSSLRGARMLPTSLIRCDLRRVDLRACTGVIDAEGCYIRGALWNESTQLGGSGDKVPSAFANCMLDTTFRRHLASQGVVFPRHLSAQRKATYKEAWLHQE
jgi:hypothetical protein